MIYLASPYLDKDPALMEWRFDAVCRKAGELMKRGLIVYSPIAHCHPIAVRVGLPKNWDFWQQSDRKFLSAASALYVLQLPGWESSKGIREECAIADGMGIPIVLIEP